MISVVTTVLELAGMIVVVTGLAIAAGLAVALVAPAVWAWPVGLLVWGAGAVGVSWVVGQLTEGGERE